MLKKIKKISKVITLGFISLIMLILGTGVGISKTVPNAHANQETQFDVSNLNLGGKDGSENENYNVQEADYFYNSDYPPLIAFILRIFEIATIIMPTIAVILFIIAGYMFMFSPEQIDTAKDTIKYAAIGLVVAFMSYVITIFVQGLFTS